MSFFKQTGSPVQSMNWIPLHAQVEITWKCNWRCVHCYQDDHKLDCFSTADLLRLIDELHAAGTVHLIITGGEPTVRPDLFDIVSHARGLGMTITLYTNGHLVDSEFVKKFQGLIGCVEMSLLAGDAEMHDQLAHVKGSFARAWRGAMVLRDSAVEVVIKTPILRPALPTLQRLKFLISREALAWQADPEISQTYDGNRFPVSFKLTPGEMSQFFRDFPEFNPQTGIKSPDPGVVNGMCLAGRRFCFIDARGNVYPCLNFKNGMGRAGVSLGNVLEMPFGEIWNHDEMLDEIRSAGFEKFSTCGGCGAKSGCRQCMALNFEEHSSLFKPAKIVCGLTKAAASVFDADFVPASERLPNVSPVS